MRLVKALLFSAVCSCCVLFTGCAMQAPGETADEVTIKRKRVIRTSMKQLQSDLDIYMMLDKPSKLSDRIIR